jgi:hypothetical protein
MSSSKKNSPKNTSAKAWASKFAKDYKPALKELAKK